jgi:hypothetical protein
LLNGSQVGKRQVVGAYKVYGGHGVVAMKFGAQNYGFGVAVVKLL